MSVDQDPSTTARHDIMKNKPNDIQIPNKNESLAHTYKTDKKNQYDASSFCQQSSTRHLDPIIFI